MSKQLNFAVVLSGCGVYDGSEIHEATLTLLAISKHGSNYEIFAPDINQAHVVNHLTGEEMPETRNVLVESARIARGKIKNLKDMNRQLLINNPVFTENRMILVIRQLENQEYCLKNQSSEAQFNAISGMSMQLTA